MYNLEDMTNEELFEFTQNYIDNKIKKNPKMVRYSYFEIKVKLNATDKGIERFLKCSKIILKSLGYQVYFMGEKFSFENADRIVEDNEFLIAIISNN